MLGPIAVASPGPVTNTSVTSQAYRCEDTELNQHIKDDSKLQIRAENTPSSGTVVY